MSFFIVFSLLNNLYSKTYKRYNYMKFTCNKKKTKTKPTIELIQINPCTHNTWFFPPILLSNVIWYKLWENKCMLNAFLLEDLSLIMNFICKKSLFLFQGNCKFYSSVSELHNQEYSTDLYWLCPLNDSKSPDLQNDV